MQENKVAIREQEALPATFEEVTGLAKAFVTSGYFTDTKQLSQAVVKIQAGRELGLPPVYSMQNINLIRSRLCSSANTLALLVKRSGHYNYRIKEHHDKSCTITFYERDGEKWVEVGESTFTIEDAKRADLVKPDSGWMKYPRAMLFSRAISQGARIYCPDAIGGMYTDEEIRSIPPRPEEEKEEPPTKEEIKQAKEKTGKMVAQAEKDKGDYWPVKTSSDTPKTELAGATAGTTEEKGSGPETKAVTTPQEFAEWLSSHGKQFTPSWYEKTFGAKIGAIEDIPKAQKDLMEYQGWKN